MTSVSKNVYIDKLDDIVGEYNNIYHRTIKMRPADVKDNTYIDFKKEVDGKDPKFKVSDHVRISKCKNIFIKKSYVLKKLVALQRIEMSQYFPKPYEPFGGDINVKVDLSNYATKADIKNISHVDTSSFALKKNLANLKTEIDKLDIDKLVPVPVDLSKLSNVAKNDVVKKSDCNAKIAEIENKIPDISNLATKMH